MRFSLRTALVAVILAAASTTAEAFYRPCTDYAWEAAVGFDAVENQNGFWNGYA